MQYKACLPLIAEIDTETASSVSYKANSGKAIAKLQTVQVKQNREMITEYGDDGVAEQISIFKDGDITLGTTFVPKECEPIMFGNTASTETVGTGNDAVTVPVLVDKDDDLGDYTGFGFIWAELQNGTKIYHLMWIYKVRWTQPDDDYETKGESISFKKPSITGKIATLANGEWRIRKEYTSADAAVNALKELAEMPATA